MPVYGQMSFQNDTIKISEVIISGDFEFTVLEIVKNRLQKIQVAIKPINK